MQGDTANETSFKSYLESISITEAIGWTRNLVVYSSLQNCCHFVRNFEKITGKPVIWAKASRTAPGIFLGPFCLFQRIMINAASGRNVLSAAGALFSRQSQRSA